MAMSVYHFYAAGFALIRELLHRGIHLAFVLGLVFLLFAVRRGQIPSDVPKAWWRIGGIPFPDIVLALLAVAAALYLPLLPPQIIADRVGNPGPSDIFFGSCLLLFVLEASRRSIGPTLPAIAILFLIFAYFGPYMPGALKHGGANWEGIVNHLYMTNQGIYGVAIGVVAKYVFLFILFGALAMRIGLGQLFIDVATAIAGRLPGGPAKVAILSSASMGTISGSSIANTVTTGALTIPAMKRIGFPANFAAATEATASTGGQITPPIMGAAAFIMVEYLEIPLRDILTAALFPALLHYFGILVMVHLERASSVCVGLEQELPRMAVVMQQQSLSLIPLVILVYFILSGRTPDFAAVYGIIACLVVGFLNPVNRLTLADLWNTLALGAKGTIAVGARCRYCWHCGGGCDPNRSWLSPGLPCGANGQRYWRNCEQIWPLSYFTLSQWALFFSLLLIACACIIMGAGIPTTATYIILVAVAAPALAQLRSGR